MSFRTMTLNDLRMVLNWAADEGWNPGHGDAAAFLAADPAGFFLKEVDGTPAAAISVVNHDDAFAFLGLYLCRPAFRGQGHGLDIWRHARRHAGRRCVGLDGVPAQQVNYARDGFHLAGRTRRLRGTASSDGGAGRATPDDLPTLFEMDRTATGLNRFRFLSAWFAQHSDRQTRVLRAAGRITGYATYRQCRTGTKIGPLHADSRADAKALLRGVPDGFDTDAVFIDVPDSSAALGDCLRDMGFVSVFDTARMYTASLPDARPPRFSAVATLELG